MNEKLSLYELNLLIRDALQDAFPETLWVVAEISEMKVNRTGHCYLELVEKDEATDDIRARARATIWSYAFRMIRPYFETTTGQPLSEGIKVLVQVAVEYHPAYGMSLNIKDIDPTYTLGDIFRRRKEIIRKLEEAGVLEMNKELPLPLVPQRIAVISSATAAGYQDFTDQLDRNSYGFRFEHTLFEATMQGNEAVATILAALDRIFGMEESFDAVAIIRGGGAQADLGCFDNFELAYAVAQFPLPVVTGIGHEKDDTILDLVAHTRQKTPTAVAEFFIAGVARFSERLTSLERNVVREVRKILDERREELEDIAEQVGTAAGKYLRTSGSRLQKQGQRLRNGVSRYVYDQRQVLDRKKYTLAGTATRIVRHHLNLTGGLAAKVRFATRVRLQKEGLKTGNLAVSLRRNARRLLLEAERKIAAGEGTARMMDPQNVLRRGYTITLQNGVLLKSVHAISPEMPLETRFADGSAESTILKKTSYDD